MGDPEVSVLESEACFYFTSGFEEDGSEGGKGGSLLCEVNRTWRIPASVVVGCE